MEAEILNNEGQSDAALALIEEAERRPDAIVGDCTPHCVKASILLNKVLILLFWKNFPGIPSLFFQTSIVIVVFPCQLCDYTFMCIIYNIVGDDGVPEPAKHGRDASRTGYDPGNSHRCVFYFAFTASWHGGYVHLGECDKFGAGTHATVARTPTLIISALFCVVFVIFTQEANSMYQKALELEPKAIEVLNQYAQYCSMMGDVEKAVSLLNTALPLARTRDDVQDLNQVNAMQYSCAATRQRVVCWGPV